MQCKVCGKKSEEWVILGTLNDELNFMLGTPKVGLDKKCAKKWEKLSEKVLDKDNSSIKPYSQALSQSWEDTIHPLSGKTYEKLQRWLHGTKLMGGRL